MRIPGPRDVPRKSIVERPVIVDTGELLDWFQLDDADALVERLRAADVPFHRDAIGNIYCNANRLPPRAASASDADPNAPV